MAKLLLLIIVAAAIWGLWKSRRPSDQRASSRNLREAARLLGIRVDADRATILAAHRRMIEEVHPDAGGPPALAAKVNHARDTLLTAIERDPPPAT